MADAPTTPSAAELFQRWKQFLDAGTLTAAACAAPNRPVRLPSCFPRRRPRTSRTLPPRDVTVTISNPDEFPSARILGVTAAHPTIAVSILTTGTAGQFTVRISAGTLRDHQVYVPFVYTTSASGPIKPDTRPAG